MIPRKIHEEHKAQREGQTASTLYAAEGGKGKGNGGLEAWALVLKCLDNRQRKRAGGKLPGRQGKTSQRNW